MTIKSFLTMVKTHFGMVVKVIRTNNGTEFFNAYCNELLQDLGILHQSSCVHTPQRNRVVERKHMHILNIARALRFQSKMPIKYWRLCVKVVVYLMNMLYSIVTKGKSPYEPLYKKTSILEPFKGV